MTGLTKEELEDLWNDLFIEADRAKMLEETLLRLTAFYEAPDSDDRNVVNDVFRAWVLEGNLNQRFDALAMISKFKIRSALPELRAILLACDMKPVHQSHSTSSSFTRSLLS